MIHPYTKKRINTLIRRRGYPPRLKKKIIKVVNNFTACRFCGAGWGKVEKLYQIHETEKYMCCFHVCLACLEKFEAGKLFL